MATATTNAVADLQGLHPTNLPVTPPSEQEMKTVVPPTEPWSNSRAAEIAKADFLRAERYIQQNHFKRFIASDELYLAWVNKKYWENTKIPRSSVSIFLALEQIEALLPSVLQALFADPEFFDAVPLGVSTMAQASAVKSLMRMQMDNLGDPTTGVGYKTMREITRVAYKSSLIYGNGIVECAWLKKAMERWTYERVMDEERQMVPHPLTGEPMPVGTGRQHPMIQKRLQTMQVSKPAVYNTDIRDFFWDPNCASHNVQDAGFVATRHLKTVAELGSYRGMDGFDIPSDKQLLELAKNKYTTSGDNAKAQTEVFRGMYYNPAVDQSDDPALARVEVIRYWQKGRHVWLLGRDWCAYNKPNYYNILPFLDAFYVDVPNRFAGLSICDLVESDQRTAEAIVNARLDELNLMIHAPTIKKRGMSFPASQQRLRPGVMWEAEDPEHDFHRMEFGNVTQSAYLEVDALERRVQKTTGITDLAVLGTPTAGGNSANRTATGISSQQSAAGKRVQYQVENLEDQFMVPLLDIFLSLNQKFLDPNDAIQMLGPDAQNIQIDPIDILNASVKFKMVASSKMHARAAAQQGGLQLYLQTMLNPGLLQFQSQLGIIPDIESFQRMISDMMSMPYRNLFKQLSPEQTQQLQQQMMAGEMMKAQLAQQKMQSHSADIDSQGETELMKALITKLLTPQAAHLLLGVPEPKKEPSGGSSS